MKTIEIITNSRCPKRCPNCNQNAFMTAEPDYLYSLDNTQNLIKVIRETNREREFDLVLSGGEPLIHPFIVQILRELRESGCFNTISLTSSLIAPKLEEVLDSIDNLYFSWRSIDRDNIPDVLKSPKVHIWDSSIHVNFPDKPYTGNDGYCCCTHVGVCCCIIGDLVYPCTLAKTMEYLGLWKSPYATLIDYFSGQQQLPNIGSYQACSMCPNNQGWRDFALRTGQYKETK